MSFRDNLRRYRENAGYNQAKDFAALLGIKYTTYMAYEQGREPKYDILCRIAAALNVTTDELLGHSQDKTRENIQYAQENGFIVYGEPDGSFIVKLSPQLSSVIDFYLYGERTAPPPKRNLRLSENELSEWITLGKASFENRSDIKRILKTLRREELEQSLSLFIRHRYEAVKQCEKTDYLDTSSIKEQTPCKR